MNRKYSFRGRIKGRHVLKEGRFWISFEKRKGLRMTFFLNVKDSGPTSSGKKGEMESRCS